jgi:hypothetical protein
MEPNVRACVAYIAGRLILRVGSACIYDHAQYMHVELIGTVTRRRVNVYDCRRGCVISGKSKEKQFLLYHSGHNHYLSLKLAKDSFKGYDHGKSCHFWGNVKGNVINLYDHGTGAWFKYSLEHW